MYFCYSFLQVCSQAYDCLVCPQCIPRQILSQNEGKCRLDLLEFSSFVHPLIHDYNLSQNSIRYKWRHFN